MKAMNHERSSDSEHIDVFTSLTVPDSGHSVL